MSCKGLGGPNVNTSTKGLQFRLNRQEPVLPFPPPFPQRSVGTVRLLLRFHHHLVAKAVAKAVAVAAAEATAATQRRRGVGGSGCDDGGCQLAKAIAPRPRCWDWRRGWRRGWRWRWLIDELDLHFFHLLLVGGSVLDGLGRVGLGGGSVLGGLGRGLG